jgi:hypothetical protein
MKYEKPSSSTNPAFLHLPDGNYFGGPCRVWWRCVAGAGNAGFGLCRTEAKVGIHLHREHGHAGRVACIARTDHTA